MCVNRNLNPQQGKCVYLKVPSHGRLDDTLEHSGRTCHHRKMPFSIPPGRPESSWNWSLLYIYHFCRNHLSIESLHTPESRPRKTSGIAQGYQVVLVLDREQHDLLWYVSSTRIRQLVFALETPWFKERENRHEGSTICMTSTSSEMLWWGLILCQGRSVWRCYESKRKCLWNFIYTCGRYE